ncbi:MAG: DoxX family membrane protein [Verrucomicrobiales bacterium]|jgi:uncharacterized membrane protein YphA (DoxX/SURF4 family)|nr:DoxX family membrane protein [Verrucomicrobiales bacterium]
MIKKILLSPWTVVLLRVLIAGVFIYAGATKIANPRAFADSIASFRMLPSELINVIALGLPVFEAMLGVFLLMGKWKRQAAFVILLMSLAFCIIIIQALVRGLEVNCGCFGAGATSQWDVWLSLGRDVLLVFLVWWLYVRMLWAENKKSFLLAPEA